MAAHAYPAQPGGRIGRRDEHAGAEVTRECELRHRALGRLEALTGAGLPGAELIRNASGACQFRLPGDGWADVGAAAPGVHLSGAALAAGEPGPAPGPACAALAELLR